MKKDKPIHILVISSKYPPEPSGSGWRAHQTYKRLSKKSGIRHSVLCSSVMFNKSERYFSDDVPVHRIACKFFKNLKNIEEIVNESFFGTLTRKLKNGINYLLEATLTWSYLLKNGSRFDLFHVFGKNYVIAAALSYAKIVGKPLILEICNVGNKLDYYEPWFVKALFGKGLPSDSKIVCISKRLEEMCRKSGYADEVWCRPNPVDRTKFFVDRNNKTAYRRKLDLFNDDDIILVTIGKIRPLKNQMFLLDVLKELPERYKLVIAGPSVSAEKYAGDERRYLDDMKSKVRDYGLNHRVKIYDSFVDNPDEYMKASDIYLLPSRMEACATSLLEALACGIPAVAHRIDGVTTEWIEEGINGYLAPLDAILFKEKIIMAVSIGKDKLSKRSEEIRSSSDIVDEKYARLIEELIQKRQERYV